LILERGATIGIAGGGQLGKMLAVAAQQLGFRVHVFAPPDGDIVAAGVAHHVVSAPYGDGAAFAAFANACDVVTYEFENVPFNVFDGIQVPVRPSPLALRVSQDRAVEKAFMRACGLNVARFEPVASAEELRVARTRIPFGRLKSRRMGYDGRGQCAVHPDISDDDAFCAIGRVPAILEEQVELYAETSTVLARSVKGATVAYDSPRNHHADDGILRSTTFPSPLPTELKELASAWTESLAKALDYVGVMALELFAVPDQARLLVANEMAPRVHNTGHWSLDGAMTSQFENHIRAIAGWALGCTTRTANIEMVNLLGDDVSRLNEFLANRVARPYIYGKAVTRPGRKMGHVNFVVGSVDNPRLA